MNNVDSQNLLVLHEFTYGIKKEAGAKCFVGYEADRKARPLCIKFPQMSGFLNKVKKA